MRLFRPLLWLVVACGSLIGFVALGRLTPDPLRWGDIGGWLDRVALEDALVELARWLGIVLAAYVVIVAVLVLLSELALSVRAVPVARLLHGLARVVAVPALRRRLVGASMSAVITVSAGMASVGTRAFAAAPVVQTIGTPDSPPVSADSFPAGVTSSDVVGFGLDTSAPAAGMPGAHTAVVAAGETMWGLSVAQYGSCDESIIDMVAAASGVSDPNLIFVGQTLVFPALPTVATPSTTPEVAPTTGDADTSAEVSWPSHTIVFGDTLWDIIKARYGHVSPNLVASVAQYNGIDDPSNIALGTVVVLPPVEVLTGAVIDTESAPPVAPAVEAAAPTDVQTPPVTAETPVLPPPVAGTAETPVLPPPVVGAATPIPDLPPPSTVGAPPPPADSPAAPATAGQPVAVGSVDGGTDGGSPVEPWLAGLGSATALAAGLLVAYRRLRRRQRSAGARAWRLMPSGESARLYRQLVAAADLPLVRWAGQELSGVLFDLGRPTAGPVAVELSDLTGLELLWDAPMLSAPGAWEPTPGGWSWRLLYDPASEVPEATLPAAIPGLVTVGRRHDAQVMIDLEAFGSVSIAGDARAAEDVVRALVLELGAGEELSDTRVSTVGLGVDGVEHLSRVQTRTADDALVHARGIVTDQQRVMDEAGVDGTFLLRAGGPAASREVTAIAVRAETCEVLDELLALATPRSGLVVIVLGASDAAGLDVVADSDGTVELASLGMTLESVGVSRGAAAITAVLLDGAAEPVAAEDLDEDRPTLVVDRDGHDDVLDGSDGGGSSVLGSATDDELEEADQVEDDVVADVAALCGPDGVDLVAAGELLGGGADDLEWSRPQPTLFVRVLGRPCLEPEPAKMSRYERLVTVYVASMGGEAHQGATRDAVWNGAAVSDKRFWNVVGRIRSHYGAVICPSRLTGPRSKLVRLRDTMTDLQLLEVLAARAESVPSTEALGLLLDGLNLVRGEAFDDVGFDWAIETQLSAHAAEVIESCALRAVELALAADDAVGAREAVSAALRGLPGNELLYRARMRIEAHVGNRAGVRSVYAELLAALEDLSGDTGERGDPSPTTRQLYEQLVDSASPE